MLALGELEAVLMETCIISEGRKGKSPASLQGQLALWSEGIFVPDTSSQGDAVYPADWGPYSCSFQPRDCQ